MKNHLKPHLVAIVGGSGAGKSWLVEQLQKRMGDSVSRLSLDDFYQDRSHMPQEERERINFDEPAAVDWGCVQKALEHSRHGEPFCAPSYNFSTHTRSSLRLLWRPKPLVLIEGLWLLHRPDLRRLFSLGVYVDCADEVRFRRRLARDCADRGRTESSVRRQFESTVAPMHEQYVAPQALWADVVLKDPVMDWDVDELVVRLRRLLGNGGGVHE